jgi:hypothetical protein
MCWTHVVCGTHVELFDLANVMNVTRINHSNMIDYESSNVTFDHVEY